MPTNSNNSGFNIDELIKYMEDYRRGLGSPVDAEVRPMSGMLLYESGMHFVAGHLGLNHSEEDELKLLISEHACLMEMLATQELKIPSRYLYTILLGVPELSEYLLLMEAFKRRLEPIAKATHPSKGLNPKPFSLTEDGPYTLIGDEDADLTGLINIALEENSKKKSKLLTNGDVAEKYASGEKALFDYLIVVAKTPIQGFLKY